MVLKELSKLMNVSRLPLNRSHLVFVDFRLLQFGLSLLLKGDDDQGDEDVDEEEGEDDEVDDVEDGHLDPEQRDWTLVLVGGGHRLLQDAENVTLLSFELVKE